MAERTLAVLVASLALAFTGSACKNRSSLADDATPDRPAAAANGGQSFMILPPGEAFVNATAEPQEWVSRAYMEERLAIARRGIE